MEGAESTGVSLGDLGCCVNELSPGSGSHEVEGKGTRKQRNQSILLELVIEYLALRAISVRLELGAIGRVAKNNGKRLGQEVVGLACHSNADEHHREVSDLGVPGEVDVALLVDLDVSGE